MVCSVVINTIIQVLVLLLLSLPLSLLCINYTSHTTLLANYLEYCFFTANISSNVYNQVFQDSIVKFSSLPPEHFTDTLCNILSGISFTTEVGAFFVKPTPQNTQEQLSSYVNLTLVNKSAGKYDSVQDKSYELESIQLTLGRIHHRDSSAAVGISYDNALVPSLDFTQASTSDLCDFLKLFKADVSDTVTEEEASDELLKFIPTAAVNKQRPPSKASTSTCKGCSFVTHCSWCRQECCEHYPLKICSYPRTGFVSCALCSECISYNKHQDAKEWVQASLNFLTQPNDETIIASLGCALVAIALGFDPRKLLKEIAKQLHMQGINSVAYSILNLAISISKEVEPQLCILASSILQDLAKEEKMTSKERYTLALASKEALDVALDRNATLPDSEIRLRKIECLIDQLFKERFQKHLAEERLFDIFVDLAFFTDAIHQNDAGQTRLQIIKKLQENEPALFSSSLFSSNLAQMLDSVIVWKEQQDLKFSDLPMYVKEMVQLLFLPSGEDLPPLDLADLGSILSNFSEDDVSFHNATITAMQLVFDHFHVLYSSSLIGACNKNIATPQPVCSPCDGSTSIFVPSYKELTPPFRETLPAIFQNQDLKAFEESVVQLFITQKWSNFDVTSVYIDKAPVCRSQAQKVICYLQAAMWMVKNFNSDSKYPTDVLYAYKSILIHLLRLCCETALYDCCNPALELYVIRIAIGLIRKIVQVPNACLVFTEEDAFFLKSLLKRLSKVVDMNSPSFYLPILSLSEADVADTLIRKPHSAFIFELQSINPNLRALKDVDLNYQLYQNDILFSIFPLKNSSDSRARAMDGLLNSQGLSWNDVSQAMSTPLCPRDEDGWLIQTPELGVPLEYSKLVGFVFDADKDEPSLELLVVEADPKAGKKGLFSQEDASVMLQLDLDDGALFFSLDPPSEHLDKSFHPFQQWRHPEKINGTEVLKTMFITDYLMKSFTTGTDISSKPPFKQRSCKDGLTKNLPPLLQEAIRSTKERRSKGSHCRRSRFWLESKEVKYTKSQKGSRYVYYFRDVDIEVKSESSPFGIDLTLNQDNSPESPHISFARDMTKHYSELSEYFPVFARLQELSKLQFFSLELQSLVEIVKAKYPEKAASLTCFIQSFKQNKSLPSSTCTWVPAVTSPKLQSIFYGGVKLDFANLIASAATFFCVRGKNTLDFFMSGCSGDEVLESKYIEPYEIVNQDSLQILHDVIKKTSCEVRDCSDIFHGIYLIQKEKEVSVGVSCDVFKTVSAMLKADKEIMHFSAMELRSDVGKNVLNTYLHAFMQQLGRDTCSTTNPVAGDFVKGVRFSREGAECIFDKLEHAITVSVQFKPKKLSSQKEIVHYYAYSPPSGTAEIQNRSSETRFNSWNQANLDDKESFSSSDVSKASSNDSTTLQIKFPGEIQSASSPTESLQFIQFMQEGIKELPSANERVTSSTFRQINSAELNKHLDRLYHSVLFY